MGEQSRELLGLEPATTGLVAQAGITLHLAGERHLAQLLEAVGAVLLAEVGQHERAGHLGYGGGLLLAVLLLAVLLLWPYCGAPYCWPYCSWPWP